MEKEKWQRYTQDTSSWLHLSVDELIVTDQTGVTREENELAKHGRQVVYFDSLDEFESEQEKFENFREHNNYRILAMLKTVNERIAFILY